MLFVKKVTNAHLFLILNKLTMTLFYDTITVIKSINSKMSQNLRRNPMKKRLFSLILAALMIISAASLSVFAEDSDYGDFDAMTLTVDSVTVGNDDESVDISIKIERNSGFAGIVYQLAYNKDVFSLESDPVVGNIEGMALVVSGPLDTGKHMCMLSNADGKNVFGDGTLVTYTFKINENAPAGTYEFSLITDGVADLPGGGTTPIEILDENLEKVSSVAISGAVTVPGYSVTYDANGGSGAPAGVTKSKNVDVSVSRTVPQRDGFNFLGWATSAVATKPQYQGGDKYSENADVVFYAVWEKKPETVGTVKMAVETVEGRSGNEVQVKVNITDNPAIHTMVFDVTYDENVLEYVSIEKGLYGNICIEHASKLNYQYMDLYNFGNSMTENGTLLTFTFKIKDNAPEGLTEITIVPDYDTFIKLVGEDAAEGFLDVEVTRGGVVVSGEILGDINLDETVNADDAVLLLKHFAHGTAIDYRGSLDFNGDGEEDKEDAVNLLHSVLFENPLVAENPETAKAVYTVSDAVGYTGEDVEITISLETFAELNAAGIGDITYDENALTFNGCTIENTFENLAFYKEFSDMTFISMAEDEISEFSGALLKLSFAVKEDATPGEYEITGIPAASNGDAVEAFLASGTITVKDISEKPMIPVTGITFTETSAMLKVGDKLTITPVFTPVDATLTELTWASSNTSVATVDGNGVVTALAKGSAKITATAPSGKKATCSVTVGIPADKVDFSLKATSVAVGKTLTLSAKAARTDGQKPQSTAVTFELVDGEEFVTLDAKGKITAIAEGEAVVKATAVFGTEEAYKYATIRVCNNLATKVTLNKTKAAMALGYGDLQLEATLVVKTGDCDDTLKWSVDKPEIATVDENGVVTALAVGKAKITAIAGSGKSASCTVTIGEPATAVDISSLKTTSVAPGKNVTLKGKALRDDKIKPVSTAVEFEIIEGENLATIDAKGKLVVGLEEGTVVVRIRAEAGTDEAYDDVSINICNLATKVTLNKTKASMALGYGDLELVATMTAKTGECTDTLTWSVDKPEIATVDENGLVTALAAGKVKVTAMAGSGKKATCTVTIGEAATGVELSSLKATSVAPGKNITLKGKAVRDDGIKPVSTTVEFEIIEGENLATIDAKGKLVAGLEEGTVVVRISAEAGTEDAYEDVEIRICTVATKVTLNMTKATVVVGEELQLEASMLPAETCTDTLKWTSANEEIATVDENGLVTAHSEGKVKITATAGSGKSVYCTVTVTE